MYALGSLGIPRYRGCAIILACFVFLRLMTLGPRLHPEPSNLVLDAVACATGEMHLYPGVKEYS